MTIIKNGYTDKPMFDFDGDLKATVEAGVKAFANLEGANLAHAHLEGAHLAHAHLAHAHLAGAHLEDAHLEFAHLEGAHLEGAHLEDAHLPIYCNWKVAYTVDGYIKIGCKSKTIAEWDVLFARLGNDFSAARNEQIVFDSGTYSDEELLRIKANYLAVRAYCVAMGIGLVK
jgi:hypothetical protein